MNYPIKCPHCPITVDSMDSYADSKYDLRNHILYRHPGEDPDRETDPNNSSSGSSDSAGVHSAS